MKKNHEKMKKIVKKEKQFQACSASIATRATDLIGIHESDKPGSHLRYEYDLAAIQANSRWWLVTTSNRSGSRVRIASVWTRL